MKGEYQCTLLDEPDYSESSFGFFEGKEESINVFSLGRHRKITVL